MRAIHCVLAMYAVLGLVQVEAWPAWQLPFGRSHGHGPVLSPQQPLPDSPSPSSQPKRHQKFQLQHILAHSAPGAPSAKVFRRLAVDAETRMEMAQFSTSEAAKTGDSPVIESTFEHSVSEAWFPLDDDPLSSSSDLFPDFPFPGRRRVPDPTDHATVVSMVRMALDCYVDPKRQGWVDIGDDWDVETEIGWLEAGLRGYIFSSEDQKTVIIGLKGTSLKLFGTGGGPTGNNDKLNDNKMFSCCCGKVDRTWWGVCGCYMGGNQCNQQCLKDDVLKDKNESESYYGIGLKVVEAAKVLYPGASIWLTGHSLGGSVASLLGVTHKYPTFTYQSPGDMLYGKRVGLVKDDLSQTELAKLPVWQFGHTADPIFMGTCNGATSTCYTAGYAMEAKCHLGRTCVYDTMAELGWRQNIQAHTIFTFINVVENWGNMTEGREIVPRCTAEENCEDCTQWNFI